MQNESLGGHEVSMGATSPTLINRVKGRDGTACRRLVDLYGPTVYGWSRRAGLNGADSADILQEVFRSVFSGIQSFRQEKPGDTFRGWLRTIYRNKLNDHFRRLANQPAAAGGTEAYLRMQTIADSADEPTHEVAEISALVERATVQVRGEFEPQTWKAFWLTTVENRSSTDVAQELKMTPGAVRQAKYAVLRRFRIEVGEIA